VVSVICVTGFHHSSSSLNGNQKVAFYLKKHSTAVEICAGTVSIIAIGALCGYAVALSYLVGGIIGVCHREFSIKKLDAKIDKMQTLIDKESRELHEIYEKLRKATEAERKIGEANNKVLEENMRELSELTKDW